MVYVFPVFIIRLYIHAPMRNYKIKSNWCTSHKWPIIGASAQECSAFSPIVPFLKTIRLKDLSNHLTTKKAGNEFSLWCKNKNEWHMKDLGRFCPTCHSIFHEEGTWHSCPETWLGFVHRSVALCHQAWQRRRPSQWHLKTACSSHGWSRCCEHWPTGSCKMSC